MRLLLNLSPESFDRLRMIIEATLLSMRMLGWVGDLYRRYNPRYETSIASVWRRPSAWTLPPKRTGARRTTDAPCIGISDPTAATAVYGSRKGLTRRRETLAGDAGPDRSSR